MLEHSVCTPCAEQTKTPKSKTSLGVRIVRRFGMGEAKVARKEMKENFGNIKIKRRKAMKRKL